MTQAENAVERLRALGFSERDARVLAEHFLDAERRGKRGHGLARIDWLSTQAGLDPAKTVPHTTGCFGGSEVIEENLDMGLLEAERLQPRTGLLRRQAAASS